MAHINEYDKGDLVKMTANFTDANDTAADPNTVTFKLKEPDGEVTTYESGTDPELVKESVGEYYVEKKVDQIGEHYYRFEGDGNVTAAGEGSFYVVETAFD